MQNNTNLLTLTILFLSLTSGPAQSNKTPEAVINAWENMWNTYDLAQIDQLFLADQTVTYFSSEYPGIIRGIEALRNHHKKFGFITGGKQSGNKLLLSDVQYGCLDKICLVTATWNFQREASDKHQAGPVTFLLSAADGAWRIKHAHFSNNP